MKSGGPGWRRASGWRRAGGSQLCMRQRKVQLRWDAACPASPTDPLFPPPCRYQRHDKRDKLPSWITGHLKDSHLNLSTDMLLCIARDFMRAMAQPYDRNVVGKSLLSEAGVEALGRRGVAAAGTLAAPMDLG